MVAYVASAYQLPLQDVSVDCVFFIAVLGEILDRHRALREAHRVLKPGGVVSITEDFTDPDYNTPSEVVRLLDRAGYEVMPRRGRIWLYTLNGRKTQSIPQQP